MFRVSARTVLELGSELISSDIIAFYELAKNGFDARTEDGVEIRFRIVLRRTAHRRLTLLSQKPGTSLRELQEAALSALTKDAPVEMITRATEGIEDAPDIDSLIEHIHGCFSDSVVTISDTGTGMSRKDLLENFLTIGTASRKREVEQAIENRSGPAPFLGEKGIGRLSAMRLGDWLRVETATSTDKRLNVLEIDWTQFADLDLFLEDVILEPTSGKPKKTKAWSGTTLTIGGLSSNWTRKRLEELAESEFARITDPFRTRRRRPRIALFWNKRRISIPRKPTRLLAEAHATVAGRFTVDAKSGTPSLSCDLVVHDLGFGNPTERDSFALDGAELEDTFIAHNEDRHPADLEELGSFSFEAHWFNRRRLTKVEGIGDLRTVRKQLDDWNGILLYRDAFRVFPYGEEEDDWLGLDRQALRRRGYTLNKTQFIGRVEISRVENPLLVDQTNREGLRENVAQELFVELLQYSIQERLWDFMKTVEREHKQAKRVEFSAAKSHLSDLEKRTRRALKQLRERTAVGNRSALSAVEDMIEELKDYAERARERIVEAEEEGRQLIDLAGVGLMVEVVAHELARVSEVALDTIDSLRGSDVPARIEVQLSSLKSQMRTLEKRVRVLDPLSVSGRQRRTSFSLKELVSESLEAHATQFQRHGIGIEFVAPRDVRVNAVRGMVVQILENLLSNSVYWLRMESRRTRSFRPRIRIEVTGDPPSVLYEDNGRGISVQNRERVFRPFFSLKEKKLRRGLGLFIARECAHYMNGSLELLSEPSDSTGRLNRFLLELPQECQI